MKIASFAASAVLFISASLAGTAAFAADKAQKQAELGKASDTTLQKFYTRQPALEKDVKASPGYAVFTTYGLTFLIGGAGGGGTAHDKAGKVTYMTMAQASAGPKIGVGSQEILLIFKSPEAFQKFVDKGWEFGAGGGASAGAAGKKAGYGEGDQFTNDAKVYSLSKTGVEFGGQFAGTKFWKDSELN